MARQKRTMIGYWKDGELPNGILVTARSRTEGMQRQFGNGQTTLTTFAESCYVQGISDAMEVLCNRFPREMGIAFGAMPDNPFSEYFSCM